MTLKLLVTNNSEFITVIYYIYTAKSPKPIESITKLTEELKGKFYCFNTIIIITNLFILYDHENDQTTAQKHESHKSLDVPKKILEQTLPS